MSRNVTVVGMSSTWAHLWHCAEQRATRTSRENQERDLDAMPVRRGRHLAFRMLP